MIRTKPPVVRVLALYVCVALAFGFGDREAWAAPIEAAGMSIAGPSTPIAVTVDHRSGAVVIRARAVIDSELVTAWKVLTDYDRYASFVPDLRSSRVVARHGHHVVVEQDGIAPLWLLRVPVDVVYHVTEYPPLRLTSHAATSGGTTLDSEYRLTPEPNGVRLDYTGTLAPQPGVLAGLREDAGEHAIVEHFRALAKAIEREARFANLREPGDVAPFGR